MALPFEMRARVREVAGVAGAAVLAAVIVVVLCAACASVGRTPTTIGVAGIVALLPPFLSPHAVRALGPRGRVLTALAPLTFAPLVALAAAAELSEPVLACYQIGGHISALLVRGALIMLPAGIGATVLCWLVIGRERLAFDRGVRTLALAAIAIAVIASVSAAIARRTRADAEEWLKALPALGHVPHGAYWVREPIGPDNARRYHRRVNAGTLSIECRQYRDCDVSFIPSGVNQRSRGAPVWFEERDPFSAEHLVQGWGSYAVVADARHRIYLLDHSYRGSPFTAFAFDGTWLGELDRRALRDVLAPPQSWTVTAAGGALVAIIVLALGRRRRIAREAVEWIDGRVGNDGAILLTDGTRLPGGDHLPGTRVVVAGVTRAASTYREDAQGRAAVVVEGAAAEQRDRAIADHTASAAWALAIVTLTSAPLLAFAAIMLVG